MTSPNPKARELREPDLWTVEELEDADGRRPMWNSYGEAERFRRETVDHLNDVTPLTWDELDYAILPVWIGDPRTVGALIGTETHDEA